MFAVLARQGGIRVQKGHTKMVYVNGAGIMLVRARPGVSGCGDAGRKNIEVEPSRMPANVRIELNGNGTGLGCKSRMAFGYGIN